jgi:hypothetical protein
MLQEELSELPIRGVRHLDSDAEFGNRYGADERV